MELTFNLTEDRREPLKPQSLKDFELTFGNGSGVNVQSNNWVQGRLQMDNLRQTFVNIQQGKDNEPFDITGYILQFCGRTPFDGKQQSYRVIDNSSVVVDGLHGRFRYTFPAQAFAVAGTYKQAYFRLIRLSDYKCIATLEFDLSVLEDFVFADMVPSDYISPFNDILNQLLDGEKKFKADTQTLYEEAAKRLNDAVTQLTQLGTDVKTTLTTEQTALQQLIEKIKENNLFTQAEADTFKQAITKQLNSFIDTAKKMLATADYHLNYHAMSVSLSPTMAVDTNELNHLKYMQAQIAVCDMVNIESTSDDAPQTGDQQRLTQFLDQFKAAGLETVMLKPHLGINWDDSFYRGNYDPVDYNVFFTNWEKILMYYAGICDQHKIPILCIGCEQVKTTQPQYSGSWKLIISDIKAKYPNLLLTYALSGDEMKRDNGDWLGKLDFIGTNIYPSYTSKIDNGSNISREEIVKGFYYDRNGTQYGKLLEELHQRYHKLIYVTETGVMPQDDGLIVSESEKAGQKPYDLNVSALAVDAAINGWMQDLPFVIGFNWWHLRGPYNIWDISTTDASKAQEIWLNKFGGDN